jgi:hypothetical protein
MSKHITIAVTRAPAARRPWCCAALPALTIESDRRFWSKPPASTAAPSPWPVKSTDVPRLNADSVANRTFAVHE